MIIQTLEVERDLALVLDPLVPSGDAAHASLGSWREADLPLPGHPLRHHIVMSARVHSDPAFQSELFLADGLNSSSLYILDIVGADRQYGSFIVVENVV